jgi:hypothetical protein
MGDHYCTEGLVVTQHQKILSILWDGQPHGAWEFTHEYPRVMQYNARIKELRRRGFHIPSEKIDGHPRFVLLTPRELIDREKCTVERPKTEQGELF